MRRIHRSFFGSEIGHSRLESAPLYSWTSAVNADGSFNLEENAQPIFAASRDVLDLELREGSTLLSAAEITILGDVDFNGYVDISDLHLIKMCLMTTAETDSALPEACEPADLNRDGVVDMDDLLQAKACIFSTTENPRNCGL